LKVQMISGDSCEHTKEACVTDDAEPAKPFAEKPSD